MATAEATLRANILRAIRHSYTRRQGVLVFGRPASAATGPGHPDLFGVVQGSFMGLEIKTRTGKPTPLQIQRLQELRECGAHAWVVRSPEQALRAIRWILEGGRAPMTDEPIDLNAWLNEAPLSAVEQGAAEAVASVTDADIAEAQADLDARAQEVGTDDLLATFPAALSGTVENGTVSYEPEPLPDFEDLAQPAPEMSRAEKLADLDKRSDKLNQDWPEERALSGEAETLGDDPANESHETRVFHSMLRNDIRSLQADVRTVGERVTLAFESLNRLETDVAAFGQMFRALLKALEVDESELPVIPPAEPKRTRTRRAKAAE